MSFKNSFLRTVFIFLGFFFFCQELLAQKVGDCQVFVPPTMFQDRLHIYGNSTYNTNSNTFFRQYRRDPSGMMFIQLSSFNPLKSFFVTWNGQVVEINPFGVVVVGSCIFSSSLQVQNNYGSHYQQLAMSNFHVRGLSQNIPTRYVNSNNLYSSLLYATENEAKNCQVSASINGVINETKFRDCMINKMLGQKESKIYNCAKDAKGDKIKMTLCSMAVLGGRNERAVVNQVSHCYDTYKKDFEKYPLCMATQNMDDDLANLVSCIQKQSQRGDVNFYTTVACYGSQHLNLTAEQQIVLECAVSTSGQPKAFALCSAGKLTARELDKCFTHGIGRNGCFGPNNDIIKALNKIGGQMATLGLNNHLVKSWDNAVNDLSNGPGKNHIVTKTIKNIANDVTKGPGKNNDLVKAIERVVPGFKFF